jgi:hypothetical protein
LLINARKKGRAMAVASIFRDLASLRAEIAIEQAIGLRDSGQRLSSAHEAEEFFARARIVAKDAEQAAVVSFEPAVLTPRKVIQVPDYA